MHPLLHPFRNNQLVQATVPKPRVLERQELVGREPKRVGSCRSGTDYYDQSSETPDLVNERNETVVTSEQHRDVVQTGERSRQHVDGELYVNPLLLAVPTRANSASPHLALWKLVDPTEVPCQVLRRVRLVERVVVVDTPWHGPLRGFVREAAAHSSVDELCQVAGIDPRRDPVGFRLSAAITTVHEGESVIHRAFASAARKATAGTRASLSSAQDMAARDMRHPPHDSCSATSSRTSSSWWSRRSQPSRRARLA